MRRQTNEASLLSRLNSPAELRRLAREKLPQLAAELRRHCEETAALGPDELAESLAAVELTIALHYTFRTPNDRLIWDGGQPTLAHRALTARRPRLQAVRARAATAVRADNKYNHFGVGHTSTAISAALGMASAAALKGESRRAVAIIGDRDLAAGMAFEALNHAGSHSADLLVVLNDSGGSFAGGADALSEHFARAFSGPLYGQLRRGGKRLLRQMPTMRELARRSEKHLKGMVLPGTLFEEIGFNYTGPLDGQDIKALVRALQGLQQLRGRQFLHVVTDRRAHPRAKPRTPLARARRNARGTAAVRMPRDTSVSYAGVFDRWLTAAARLDPRIVCVNAGAAAASGVSQFIAQFPQRHFDVTRTEQHAVTFAAGLATEGRRPVVAITSSLLQRAYDQLVHDVVLQKLPVLLAVDGAGLTGGEAGHQGSFDLSYLRCLPGLTLATPGDENECRQLLHTASLLAAPAAVRFPDGPGPGAAESAALTAWPSGRGELRREGGSGLALLVFGAPLAAARHVAERLDATLVNMRFVKPLDEELLARMVASHRALVTIEENSLLGGAGSAVGEVLAARGLRIPLLQLGIPDRFMAHATREACLSAAGLDVTGLTASITRWWECQRRQRQRRVAAS
jgi:1-deoxy-D-xylulose-5-phosphate synthase